MFITTMFTTEDRGESKSEGRGESKGSRIKGRGRWSQRRMGRRDTDLDLPEEYSLDKCWVMFVRVNWLRALLMA